MLLWSSELIAVAHVLAPAASPPTLKSLQSIVTLLALIVIRLPLLALEARSFRRHQAPCVVMVAGIESMKPVQVS